MHEPRTEPAISTSEIESWLGGEYPGGDAALAHDAYAVTLQEVGSEVHLRGLVEFSNRCNCDCRYCGIRKSAGTQEGGSRLQRFTLSEDEIVTTARRCVEAGYGSMTLQSGERRSASFVRFVVRVVRRIKTETRTSVLPKGLGITVCIGEQSEESYRRLFDAGAHRYLLRIETSNPDLFARLHPRCQRFDDRLEALHRLKAIGFQVGTGVMIGLPGQSLKDLAADIQFFRSIDADMIGMGPYLERSLPVGTDELDTDLVSRLSRPDRLRLSLRMIAATRLVLRDVNIAATTALQAISPHGREAGLAFGANVLMPIMTPKTRRGNYLLYHDKPCVDEDSTACVSCTVARIHGIGRPIGMNTWGDSPHFERRMRSPA